MPNVMLKNFQALFKRFMFKQNLQKRIFLKYFICVFIFIVLIVQTVFISAQDESSVNKVLWYRSNSSGMAIESVTSRIAALRNEYCISVERVGFRAIPGILWPYYDDTYLIELRILYEKGMEYRRQMLFLDSGNTARLVASGGGGFLGEKYSGEEKRSGLIEIRDSDSLVTREFRYEEDFSEWDFRFFYNEKVLLKTETWFKNAPAPVPAPESSQEADENSGEAESTEKEIKIIEPPVLVLLTTDFFRYSRSGSLRAIDRTIHESLLLSRVSFPRLGPGIASADELVNQNTAHGSEFLLNVSAGEVETISYTYDSRGRVLTEVWKDAEDEILGEFLNTWSSDRLQSVHWKSVGDERIVEYEYDADGNRIAERNFRNGKLERSVMSLDNRDIEEVYFNGRIVLRAVWENGLKISEERISSNSIEREYQR